jgi:putative NIF3 family GTP cyclohydrolase 1 type 2
MAEQPPAPPPALSRMPQHTGPITALQYIQRIIAKIGAANRPQTVDHVSAGDPTQAVTGIAVMAIASLAGIKAAAATNCNLVVTYDPAFWDGADNLDRLEGNALFQEKRDFLRTHNMVVFNLHDHWRDRMPDGIAIGMTQALGWEKYADAADPNLFRLPSTTLLALANALGGKLHDQTLRVVGDPKLAVATIATSWGNAAQIPTIGLLNGPADVVVCGYSHEWEAVEYCQDMIAAGGRKGMILLGQAASVQAGMKYCADWLGTFITEVSVRFAPLPEPYWNP